MNPHQYVYYRSLLPFLNTLRRIAQRISPGTPPISTDDPPTLRESQYLNASEVLHVHGVSSCDKRTFCEPRLQPLLTFCGQAV